MKRQVLLAVLFAASTSVGSVDLFGADGPPVDVAGRARGAGKVVVATATSVSPRWRTNAFGDRLIVSLVGLEVEETLKGLPGNFAWLDVEGGTLDGLTLHVSSMPELRPGDRAVFFLDETSDGSHVPHLKGKGILKLDKQNQVPGDGLGLDDIRRMVRGNKN